MIQGTFTVFKMAQSLRNRVGVFLLLSGLTLSSYGANRAPSNSSISEDIQIDRIDFIGVKIFSATALENRLEVSPGDKLSRQKVLATERNIIDLYFKHGYEGTRIESRLTRKKGVSSSEIVLEFKVNEGKPVRVSAVSIVLTGMKDRVSEKAFENTQGQMKSAIPLSPGDVLDEDKIDEGRRAIQEILASKEYVGGKIVETKIFPSTAPPTLELNESQKAAAERWVSLEIKIDVGERVNFGYRGNRVFTVGFLDGLIKDQRLIGLGRDYVAVIQGKIEEEYRAIGYAKVKVTPFIYEASGTNPRRVSLNIEEGPRVTINKVEFDGNIAFSSKDLKRVFFERASALVQHGFYVEKDIQRAGETLVEYLKENGYLAAKLITTNTTSGPKVRGVYSDNVSLNLLFYLYEGDQTKVNSIKLEGNLALSREEILRLLGVRENSPLNLYRLGDGLEGIKRVYRNLGYLDISIPNEGTSELVTYSHENHFADLYLNIIEGPQSHVAGIEIEGLDKTQEFIVRRELKFNEGDVLTNPLLEDAERSLRRMGIFANIGIRTIDDPSRAGYKLVHISLQEGDRGVLSFGPGFRTDLGMRAFSQLSFSNIWGKNHSVSIYTAANRRFENYNFAEGQAQISYTWPWFLIPGMTFRPNITMGRTQYLDFAADTLSGAANFEKTLLSKPTIIGYLTYSFESINQFGATNRNDNQQMILGTITPKLSFDLRDNPLAPKSGFFAVSWADLNGPMFGSQSSPFPISYYRAQLRTDYYVPIGKDVSWYISFRTGYEKSLANTRNPNDPNANRAQDAIPLIKQFTMGGVGSLRGFREQALNYQTQNIRGSISYVNYRTQLDFTVTGSLKFGLFFDAANLLLDNYSFTEGLRSGAGPGFHYETPVGPISLDLGFNLAPKTAEDRMVVHISVGVL
ncbi:MAG: BamA/TamA family outer membrane protein [Bdellovibrio sp.]|nr:BamA/TamA family outer membrane protein [Bdellovibrio sp.]